MHHANLLVGEKDWALSRIPATEKKEGQDVSVTHYERMSIKDVRNLQHEAMLRPIAREYRTFVISVDSILHEAQNALLKLFEEPNAHTVFYIIVPYEDMLLPTLRSRLFTFAVEHKEKNLESFNAFIQLSYKDRLALIAEKLADEDSHWVTEFLVGLKAHATKSKDPELMKDVLMILSYVHAGGSSKKMLLEHVALSLK